jgi:hypothetical protein
VATELRIPLGWDEEAREKYAVEYCKEKGFAERNHEVQAWADKGLKQWKVDLKMADEYFEKEGESKEVIQEAAVGGSYLKNMLQGIAPEIKIDNPQWISFQKALRIFQSSDSAIASMVMKIILYRST